jgi:hypothetical protein
MPHAFDSAVFVAIEVRRPQDKRSGPAQALEEENRWSAAPSSPGGAHIVRDERQRAPVSEANGGDEGADLLGQRTVVISFRAFRLVRLGAAPSWSKSLGRV